MENFKNQIDEDIQEIQEQYLEIDSKLKDEDYAFNFWILQKLFKVEENLIPDYILEDHDRGIDCFFFNEDSRELYLIQNKYYSPNTKIDIKSITDQFFSRPLEHLNQKIYTRSKELQDIFTKYKNDDVFRIKLYFFVTNNNPNYEYIKEKFLKFKYNKIAGMVSAEFFCLDDIENIYFERRIDSKKNFETDIYTMNKHTRIDIDPSLINSNNSQLIRSQVMPVNVNTIYELMKKAKQESYDLFEENIRDYIGDTATINAGIIKTLKDPNERSNFIYYNNGITIIADEIITEKKEFESENNHTKYKNTNKTTVKNPQIVNGCQTVNSIYQAIHSFEGTDYERKQAYKDVYVMVKLLQLSAEQDKNTYLKIVEYNNSQNAIKLKDFVASQEIFDNLKNDISNYGFFLMNRQSDKNDFKNLSKAEKEKMLSKAKDICSSLNIDINQNDIKIDLTKFMQTILAYYEGGYIAYTKKSDILKKGTTVYKNLIDKIRSLTTKQKLSIYLYYLKSEKEKKLTEKKLYPVPYYLLTFLGKKQNGDVLLYENPSAFLEDYEFAKTASNSYMTLAESKESQYNKLIKQKMYEDLLNLSIKLAEKK